MSPDTTGARKIALGPMLAVAVGMALLFLGGRGLYSIGHFRLVDALYCGLLMIPAALLLIITSYVLQHAKFVAVLPVLFAGVAVRTYPSFAVALGVTVLVAVLGPELRDRKDISQA